MAISSKPSSGRRRFTDNVTAASRQLNLTLPTFRVALRQAKTPTYEVHH